MTTPDFLRFFATCLFSNRSLTVDWVASINEESTVTRYTAKTIKDLFHEVQGLYKFTFQDIKPLALTEMKLWRNLTDSERSDLKKQQRIEKPQPWSSRKSLKHGMLVEDMKGDEIEFSFKIPSNFSATNPDEDIHKIVQDPHTRMTPCTIKIRKEMFSYFKTSRRSPEGMLKFNFFLAVILLHEVAHAVESGRPECRERVAKEARFPDEELHEMGYQLEKMVFGGHPCESRDTAHWLRFADGLVDATTLHYIVPMSFVTRIQQQKLWDTALSTKFRDPALFHIPKTIPCENSAEINDKLMEKYREPEEDYDLID